MVKRLNLVPSKSLHLSDLERSGIVWAIEVARAILLRDPDVAVLLADPAVSAELLDDLADRLVLTGQPASASGS